MIATNMSLEEILRMNPDVKLSEVIDRIVSLMAELEEFRVKEKSFNKQVELIAEQSEWRRDLLEQTKLRVEHESRMVNFKKWFLMELENSYIEL